MIGQTVFFSPNQVMEWIKKAPSVFSVYARNPEHNILLGGERTEFAAGYGAPAMIDQKGMRRSAMFSDYLNFLKLVQQCPFFNINGGILVQPSDISPGQCFPSMLYATLIYSDKCLMGGAGGAEETNTVLDMLDIVFGKESLIRTPRILAILNSTSPLQFDHDTLDTLLLFTEYGQPVIITPAVMRNYRTDHPCRYNCLIKCGDPGWYYCSSNAEGRDSCDLWHAIYGS